MLFPVFSVSFSGHQHYRVGDLRNIGLGGGSRMLVAWICSACCLGVCSTWQFSRLQFRLYYFPM